MESDSDSDQSGTVVGRGRGRVRRLSEIDAAGRPRVETRKEEPRQIGMLTPETLAMITQAVHATVQPFVKAEQVRMEPEAQIVRELESERLAAAEEVAARARSRRVLRAREIVAERERVRVDLFPEYMTSTDAASILLQEDATTETVAGVRALIQGFV